jgi:hypothetical protein
MEPQRPIEEKLRAYGKARREKTGGPLELHPSNRRQLHSEIRSRLRDSGGRGGSLADVFRQFWPKSPIWATALGLFLVAVVALPFLMPGKARIKTEMAQANRAPTSETVNTPAPAPSSAVGPARTDYALSAPRPAGPVTKLEVSDQETPVALSRQSTPPPAPAAAPVAARVLPAIPPPPATQETLLAETEAAQTQQRYGRTVPRAESSPLATSQWAAAKAATSGSPSRSLAADSRTDLKVATSSTLSDALQTASAASVAGPGRARFASVPSTPATADTAEVVLASFDVEPSGRELRVIDSDGSVYTGFVEAAARVRPARTLVTEKRRAVPLDSGQRFTDALGRAPAESAPAGVKAEAIGEASQPAGNPAFFFQVSGTNRSLKQPVIFTGNLSAMTNRMPATAGFYSVLTNGTISGKLTIGGKQRDFRAVSAEASQKAGDQ